MKRHGQRPSHRAAGRTRGDGWHDQAKHRRSPHCALDAQIFEEPRDGPSLEPRSLIGAPHRRVPRVVARFYHHHPQARVLHTTVRVTKECTTDSAALMVGVNNKNVDLAHVVIGVKPGADPSDRMPEFDSDIHTLWFGVEHLR